jgi:ATP-binding protein involved in chromosome partitioning
LTPEPESAPDFRRGMIGKRLKGVKKLLLVMSGKGGVGKSVVSATLAAILSSSGFKVGLMDADIYGPSSALLFDAREPPDEGPEGLIPPEKSGVKIMSVDLFAPGRPVPLTGSASQQVLLELLALTDWGELDCLVVDMPPATADIMMSLTSLGKQEVAAVVVTMPDKLSTTVAHRVLEILKSGRIQTVGILGNMLRTSGPGFSHSSELRKLAKEFNTRLLGLLPYDAGVTMAVEGHGIEGLVATRFAKQLERSMHAFIASLG